MAHPYANSPLNHCDSEMMHQGGWAKMRTLILKTLFAGMVIKKME